MIEGSRAGAVAVSRRCSILGAPHRSASWLGQWASLALLGAASLAACGGSDDRPVDDDSPADARRADDPTDARTDDPTDARTDAPAETTHVCEERHLVCGTVGAESCGSCGFTATCLPEQTGCLEARPLDFQQAVSLAGFDAVDFHGRFVTLGQTEAGSTPVIAVSDGGRITSLGTANNSFGQSFGHSAGAVYWRASNGALQLLAEGATSAISAVTGLGFSRCVNLAITGRDILCSSGNGILRYLLNSDIGATLEVNDSGAVGGSLVAEGDRFYYTSGGVLHGQSLTTRAALPVAPQLPPGLTIVGLTTDELFLRAGGEPDPAQLWRMPLDGATATLMLTDERFDVLGIAPGEVILGENVPIQRIGRLTVASREIEPLLTSHPVVRASKRGDGRYAFLGSFSVRAGDTDGFLNDLLQLTR